MTDISNIAASGIRAAAVQLQSAAQKIANAPSRNYQPTHVAEETRGDGGGNAKMMPAAPADLPTQLAAQQEASVAERANMAVFAAAGRAYQSLLGLIR